MLNRLFILLIGIAFVFLFSFTQKEKDVICWSENRPLTWDDFKGKKSDLKKLRKGRKHKKTLALCSTTIEYDLEKSMKNGKDDVRAVFNKKKSLKAPKEFLDDFILKHEQYHFNITELYVRKFRKGIEPLRDTLKFNAFNDILKDYMVQWKVYQSEYDSVTEHGSDRLVQIDFEEKIDIALKELEDYKSND
jgi:hypothetical protein